VETVTGGFTNALQAGHATYPNPVGFLPRHGWYGNLLTVIFASSVVTAIGVVASVFGRRRGASHERRQLRTAPAVGPAKVLCAGFSLGGTERDLGIPW
jgi:hypothetical protein